MTPEDLNNAVQSAALRYAGTQTAGRRLAGIGWHTCDTPALTKSTAKSHQQLTDSQPFKAKGFVRDE